MNFLANTLAGVASFPQLIITHSGQNLLRFTAPTVPSPAFSQQFTVTPASPVGIAVSRQPGPAINGYPLPRPPLVDIVDVYGNPCPTPAVATAVTAALLGNPSRATLDCGVGAFVCTRPASVQGLGRADFAPMSLNNPGEGFSLLFSAVLVRPNGSAQVVNATSAPFNITGWQETLRIDRQPAQGRCGEPLQTSVLVSALDSRGRVVVAVSGTVSASIASYPGSSIPELQGTTSVAIAQGAAQFTDLRIDRSGSGYSLALSFGPLSVQSVPFIITGGKADSLRILNFTSQVAAAQPFTCVLATFDACNNIVPESFVLSAQLLLSSYMTLVPSPTISPPGPTSYVGGLARVALSVNTANLGYRINFTATSSVIGRKWIISPTLNVTIGSISRLQLDSVPTGGISSLPLAPSTVSGVDGGSNVIPNLAGQIRVRKLSGDTLLSTLSGTTRLSVAKGSAVFADLALSGADGALVLEFAYALDDASPPQVTVGTAPVIVTGPTARIRLINVASSASGGQTFAVQPVLSGVDYLSRVVRAPLTISASVSNGANFSDSLQGNRVLRSNVDGLVKFTDLMLMTAGTRSLVFTSGQLTATQSLVVAVGAPSKLVTVTQPPDPVLVNTVFPRAPSVSVLDLGNNVVTSQVFLITATLGANSHAAKLSGTTVFQGKGGIATFSGLSVDTMGGGYSLYFQTYNETGSTLNLVVYSSYFQVQGPISAIVVKYFVPGGFSQLPLTPAIQIAAVDTVKNLRTYNDPSETTTCSVVNVVPAPFSVLSFTARPIVNGVARFDDIQINDGGRESSGVQLQFRCDVTSSTQVYSVFCYSPFFTLMFGPPIVSRALIKVLPSVQGADAGALSSICKKGTTIFCAPRGIIAKLGKAVQPAIGVEVWSDPAFSSSPSRGFPPSRPPSS